MPIDELISPLRYDIIIRVSFFERFGGAKEDIESELPSLLADPYFVWFREVKVPRRWPVIRNDPQLMLQAFTNQVRRALDLYDEFIETGFDIRRPVTLRSSKRVLPTVTGKVVERIVYMGDGCHRLALLKLDGKRWLEPNMYRLRSESHLTPHDNTGKLLEHLDLTSAEYCRFLSLGYGVPPSDTVQELVERVRKHQPARVSELLDVIRLDEAR